MIGFILLAIVGWTLLIGLVCGFVWACARLEDVEREDQ